MGGRGIRRAKKGAHYSAPRRFGTGARARSGSPSPCWGAGAGAAPAARPEADARKTEAQLEAVKAEIERITREVSAEQVERQALTRELKSAELSVGEARSAWLEVRRQRAETAARRAALATEKKTRENQLADNRAALAGQMRAAYLIGRQEPMKLLLNQKDPALAGRMFAYYSYFGRARAGQIKLIEDDVQRIAELETELASEDAQLAELEKQQRAQLQQARAARASSARTCSPVWRRSRTRAPRTSSA